jgi:hypothetical protein
VRRRAVVVGGERSVRRRLGRLLGSLGCQHATNDDNKKLIG